MEEKLDARVRSSSVNPDLVGSKVVGAQCCGSKCIEIGSGNQCCGAGAGGAEIILGPGAGVENKL